MKLEVTCFFEKVTWTCQYVIADTEKKVCALLDLVWDFDHNSGRMDTHSLNEIVEFVKSKGYKVEWILETHMHADHLSGAKEAKKVLGGHIGIGENVPGVQKVFKSIFDLDIECNGSQFDRLFKDGEEFKIGDLPVKVMYTPGHTPACVTYLVNNEAVFVGDTIFAEDYGTARCDFPGGSAKQMWHSIQKIMALPDATKLYYCHDYMPNGRAMQYVSTVGGHRQNNIHIKGFDEAKYIEMREARDKTLLVPKLILPSLQVNVYGGELPAKHPGETHHHLKIPINVLGKK